MQRLSAAALLGAGAPLGVLAMLLGFLLVGGADASECNPAGGGVTVDPAAVPDTQIAGYRHDQLVNAATIIQAGKDLGLGVRDQTIGVMTAMGESSLRVVDHGDAAGPDSRGLFQQRANGAWGSYADRMDPYRAATSFFRALARLDQRDALEPTLVAHQVQRNVDPYYYARYWDAAVAVVAGLSGGDIPLRAGTGDQVCTTGSATAGQVSPTGWAAPAAGPVTSRYGPRLDPVSGQLGRLHTGTDLGGGGEGGPIWAAQDGTVTAVYTDRNGGWTIDIDHGGGVTTRYKHMWANGVLVRTGQQVHAGQQIGRVGSSGWSTGPHLHFEVLVNDSPVDPQQFMAKVGVQLGQQ